MSLTSSEYDFPIFISSTDYNLIDLRAEIAKYLSDLGYKPVLSSSDGFHDNSPTYQPWESCLLVLQSCYVMVLIIDNKYGTKFKWPNFTELFEEREVSPTHAEYLFAHKGKMRMLVFIRSSMLTHYQSYRSAMKIANDDKKIAKENLGKVLPKNIEFETLEFIEEVKTTYPIPWVKGFENVTDIKKEIQKKLLNELAELFLFKTKHMEAVIREFSKVFDGLPEEKRKEILTQLGATQELTLEIEKQTKTIQELKTEREQIEERLNSKSLELEKTKNEKTAVKDELNKTISKLNNELKSVKMKILTHENTNASYLISGSTNPVAGALISGVNASSVLLNGLSSALGSASIYVPNNFPGANLSSIIGNIGQASDTMLGAASIYGQLSGYTISNPQRCDKCKKPVTDRYSPLIQQLRKCPTCGQNLCNDCYVGVGLSYLHNSQCKDCLAKGLTSIV